MVKSTDVLVSEAVAEAVKPLDEKLDGFIKAMNDWGNAPRGSRPALSELVTRAVPRSDPAGSATPGSPAAIVGALEEQFAKSTDPIAKSRIGEQLTLARMKAAGMDPQRPIAVGSGS